MGLDILSDFIQIGLFFDVEGLGAAVLHGAGLVKRLYENALNFCYETVYFRQPDGCIDGFFCVGLCA